MGKRIFQHSIKLDDEANNFAHQMIEAGEAKNLNDFIHELILIKKEKTEYLYSKYKKILGKDD